MAKFKVLFDGEYEDEIFDTEEDAEEYALYLCSCTREGTEILHMSNPAIMTMMRIIPKIRATRS